MATYKRGLLSLSADPITFGHLDLIRRAGSLCEELLVAVSDNPDKTYVLSSADRLKLTIKSVQDFCPDIKVQVFASSQIVTDMVLQWHPDVLFRGARDAQDVEYESLQTIYHEMVLPGIAAKTVILPADPNLTHIQSTVARNFARRHLDATAMVPLVAQARLWRIMHGQKFIGVTGDSGAGLSTVANGIRQALDDDKLPATIIEIGDLLLKQGQDKSPGLEFLRGATGGTSIYQTMDPEIRVLWQAHLSRQYREAVAKLKGIVIVVWPLLVEDGMLHWVNNNVVVVDGSNRKNNANTLAYTTPSTAAAKVADIQAQQQQDCYGTLLRYDNNMDFPDPIVSLSRSLGKQVVDLVRVGEI